MFRKHCSHDWTQWVRYNNCEENPKVRFCKKCSKREFSESYQVELEFLMEYCKENMLELSKKNLYSVMYDRKPLIELFQCQACYDRCKWGLEFGERLIELTEEDMECINFFGIVTKVSFKKYLEEKQCK